MTGRVTRIWLAVFSLLAALTVAAQPASAGPSGCDQMICPGPGGGGGGGGGGGSSTGHATVRNCSLYANPSNFGYVCLSGSATDVTTVKQLLHGDPPPTCWDQAISADDAAALYSLDPNPGAPYYVRSCITGLLLDHSAYFQPDLQLNQEVIEIPVNSPDCPLPLKQKDLDDRRCVATLTNHQHQVITFANPDDARIPGLFLDKHPSSTIRTNVDSTYVNAPRDPDTGDLDPVYIEKNSNGVHLWAEMTEYKLLPYGPDGGHAVSCRVGPDHGLNDDAHMTEPPCDNPPALHWTYPESSAGQADQTYPLRIQANWTVFYTDAAGQTRRLATFEKYGDYKEPVYDVQTIVVH